MESLDTHVQLSSRYFAYFCLTQQLNWIRFLTPSKWQFIKLFRLYISSVVGPCVVIVFMFF